MKKLMILMLIAAMILPCAALLAPVPARADMVYIIPDSNTRKLTYEELRGNDKYPGYTYDTLMFAFNEIYARYFTGKPARSCVAVKTLPAGAMCEIEAIAEIPE